MNKLIFGLLTLLLIFPLFIYAQPITGARDCCVLRTKVNLGSSGTCDPSKSDEKLAAVTSTDLIAQQCGSYTHSNICASSTGPIWATFCLIDSIQYATNWIFYILSVVVALLAIYGAFVITTAAGDPNKVTSGRQILTFALIGLALALFAKFLPSIVIFFVGR